MNNIIQLPARTPKEETPAEVTVEVQKEARSEVPKVDANKQSAALFGAVVSVLKFYAGQGWDDGRQARLILSELGVFKK